MSEESTEKVVNKRQFVALVKLSDQTKSKISELAGTFGERVKNVVENGNLHAGAFRIICRMNRMEEMKRNDFERALRLYLDFGGELLWGQNDHTGDLVEEAEKAEASPEAAKQQADEAAAKKNAKALKGGIKQLVDETEDEKIARQKAEDDAAFKSDVAAQKARAEGSKKVVGFPGAGDASRVN